MTQLPENQLTLLDHLKELRRVVIIIVTLVITASAIAHVYRNEIINLLLLPLGEDVQPLQFLSPLDPLFFILKVDFTVGIIVTLPIAIFLLTKFFAPAVKFSLLRAIVYIVAMTILSMTGVIYGFKVVIPIILNFMSGVVVPGTVIAFTAHGYLGFMLTTISLLALVFQIPLLIICANQLGLVDLSFLANSRRYIYTAIFIFCAIITPTTDIVTLALVTTPALIMFEIGIILAKVLNKTNRK